MINRVRRGTVPTGSGETVGLAVDARTNQLTFNLGVQDNDLKRRIPGETIEKKTANFTVSERDHGKTFVFDSTTSVVASLPAVRPENKGMRVRFIVEQLTTQGGHAISPDANDQIMGNGFTPADNKDAICTAASDRVGDMIEVVSDGELGWYITSVIGTWAREN